MEMTRQLKQDIEILKEIIDEGWLISDIDKCVAIDTCERAIQALKEVSNKCEDCISRFSTEQLIRKEYCNIPSKVYNKLMVEIDELPSVTPKSDKPSGKWTTKPHVYGVTYCSECDFELKIDDTNYCPNCGAKMVKPQESEVKDGECK